MPTVTWDAAFEASPADVELDLGAGYTVSGGIQVKIGGGVGQINVEDDTA